MFGIGKSSPKPDKRSVIRLSGRVVKNLDGELFTDGKSRVILQLDAVEHGMDMAILPAKIGKVPDGTVINLDIDIVTLTINYIGGEFIEPPPDDGAASR